MLILHWKPSGSHRVFLPPTHIYIYIDSGCFWSPWPKRSSETSIPSITAFISVRAHNSPWRHCIANEWSRYLLFILFPPTTSYISIRYHACACLGSINLPSWAIAVPKRSLVTSVDNQCFRQLSRTLPTWRRLTPTRHPLDLRLLPNLPASWKATYPFISYYRPRRRIHSSVDLQTEYLYPSTWVILDNWLGHHLVFFLLILILLLHRSKVYWRSTLRKPCRKIPQIHKDLHQNRLHPMGYRILHLAFTKIGRLNLCSNEKRTPPYNSTNWRSQNRYALT